MSGDTIMELIQDIEMSKVRRNSNESESMKPRKWMKADESFILEIVINYGEDISFIQNYFPDFTSKQVRRKVREVCNKKKRYLMLNQQKKERERKKSIFEEEILQESMISSNKNNQQSGNSSNNL